MSWVLSIVDELDIHPPPPVAVLPLGVDNNLARVLNWGGVSRILSVNLATSDNLFVTSIQNYTDEPLDKILMHVEEGPIVYLDRWHLNIRPNFEVLHDDVNYAL